MSKTYTPSELGWISETTESIKSKGYENSLAYVMALYLLEMWSPEFIKPEIAVQYEFEYYQHWHDYTLSEMYEVIEYTRTKQ